MPARRLRAKTERKFARKKRSLFCDRRPKVLFFSFFEGDNTPSLFFGLPRAQTTKSSLSLLYSFFFRESNLERKKGGHSLDFPLFSTTAPRIHWAGPLLREASSSFTLILLDHSLTLSFPPPSPPAASKLMKQKRFFFLRAEYAGERGLLPSLFASLYFLCPVRPLSPLSRRRRRRRRS